MRTKKTKQLPQTVTIKRDEKEPESMELVAKAILDIDAAFKRVSASGLRQRAITLLLYDMTKVSMGDIRAILDAAPKLADTYLRK